MPQKQLHDEFDEGELFEEANKAPVKKVGILSKYTRIPGLNIKLPTNGVFLPKGSYHPSATGEIAVYPMRAADDLMLKSPDALMSGIGIEKLIESCVPDIDTPRLLSTADLDVILLAIRAATYGDKMNVSSICPKCGELNEFEIFLPAVISTMKEIPAENIIELEGGIKVFVRPYNFENATVIATKTFEETKKVQAAEGKPDEERQKIIGESYNLLSQLNMKMVIDCILKIEVAEGATEDKDEIREFVESTSNSYFVKIDEKVKEINRLGIDKQIPCQCSHCEHEYKTELEFNPANFFASGS